MLPLLKLVSDKREYKLNDVVEVLGSQFNLTKEEKSELLPSGQTFLFGSRVGWARTYLKKAGLVDSPKRATVVITERGLNILSQKPKKIDGALLRQFPEFVEFQTPKRNGGAVEGASVVDESIAQTPEETLENGYQSIRKTLAQDLLNKIVSLSPAFFERLVVELLVKMGYGGSIADAGKALVTGKSGDEGIDGTIKEDKLGLDVIYIQAKKWTPGNVVGRPELQRFVGALAGQGAKKGVFITTSSFSKEASDYMPRNETKIVLVDGEQLAQFMIDYNLGVTVQQTYEVKRMDNDYFGE